MTNTLRDILNQRWKPEFDEQPRLDSVRKALDSLFDAKDSIESKHAALLKNEKLSPLGRLDESRATFAKGPAHVIQRAKKVASFVRDDIATWKDRLAPPTPDPTTAHVRGEIRTMLRELPIGKRLGLVLADAPDPMLVDSILESPQMLTGIAPDIRARMLENYRTRHHPRDLALIQQAEDALGLLDAATATTLVTAKAVCQFPSQKVFDDYLESIAPLDKVAAPSAATSDRSDGMRELAAYAKAHGIKSMGPGDKIEYREGWGPRGKIEQENQE